MEEEYNLEGDNLDDVIEEEFIDEVNSYNEANADDDDSDDELSSDELIDSDNGLNSSKMLFKFERISIIINRIEQLNAGAIPLISNLENYNSIEEIAYEELKQNKIPFKIKRNLYGKQEIIKLKDLTV
jgi:DNA-directed RNA polymerase subunit K/omega